MIQITNKQQYKALSDTKQLAKELFKIAHKNKGEPITAPDAYYIMESVNNLLALYELCGNLIKAQNEAAKC